MGANDIKNKTASVYIDDQPAIDAYNRLIPKADAYNKKIDEGTKKAQFLQQAIQKSLDAGGKPEALQKKLVAVNKELDNSKKALEKVTAQQKAFQQQIDSKTGPSLRQQQQLVVKLENEYKNLGQNTDAAKQKLIELEQASVNLNKMSERLNAVKNAAKESAAPSKGIFSGAFWGTFAAGMVSKATAVIKDFFQGSITEALQAEEANARFKAQLEGLGRSDAFERLEAAADKIHNKFKNIDDDDVVAVFEKLINYGKLTEKQMNDLVPIIADFAAKNRISISEATDQVTKFIETGRGMKGWGLNAKDAKTEGERLSLVMVDLKEKVNGANDAFLNTTAGGMAAAKQQFKDLKEEIGTRLIPVMNNLLGFINKALKGLTGIKRSQEVDATQKENVDNADAKNRITKIQTQIDTKFINPKTGKPVTADDWVKTIRDQIAKTTDVRERGVLGQVLINFDKSQLGTGGDTNSDKPTTDNKSDDREKLREKILDEHQKFLEALQKYNDDSALITQSEYMKELQQAFDKYDALLKMAKQEHEDELKLAGTNKKEIAASEEKYKANQLLAEEVFGTAKSQINKKFAQKELDELKKQDAEKQKLREKQLQDQLKKGFDFINQVGTDVTKAADNSSALRKATEDLEIFRATGKKKYDLQKKQLEEEKEQAIQNAITKGESVEAVQEYYRQKEEELAKKHFEEQVDKYYGYANQLLDIWQKFIDAKSSKETAALNRELRANDQQKLAYQRMLANKVISQQQYQAKISELDIAADKKKDELERKQFERNKKKQIVQAVINGIQAELKTLAEFGPPIPPNIEGIIASAFTIGATVAEIAAIKKTEYSGGSSSSTKRYEKGGVPDGPKHKDGGIDMINSSTGRKVGEMEGGEPYMILSGKTYQNNKPVVDALLYNSMHRDGATIDPWFKNRSYKAIDFNGINRSIQNVRHYESGGVFTTSDGKQQPATAQTIVVPAMTPEQESLWQALLVQLRTPQKNYVVWQEIKDKQNTENSILSQATFGKKSKL